MCANIKIKNYYFFILSLAFLCLHYFLCYFLFYFIRPCLRFVFIICLLIQTYNNIIYMIYIYMIYISLSLSIYMYIYIDRDISVSVTIFYYIYFLLKNTHSRTPANGLCLIG